MPRLLSSESQMLDCGDRRYIKCFVQIYVEQWRGPFGRAARARLVCECEIIEQSDCEVFLGLALAGVDAVNDLKLVVFGLHHCSDVAVHCHNLAQNLSDESLFKSGKGLCIVEADVVLSHFDVVGYCNVHL